MNEGLADSLPSWEQPYSDPGLLKRDILAMEAAIVEALFSVFPKNAVVGIYAKGSAAKNWSSPVDYVPEISDLDIHVKITDRYAEKNPLSEIGGSMAFQRVMESRFLKARPNPAHFPRPQILFLNYIGYIPDFVPSPMTTVKPLHGEPYDDRTDITGERYLKTILQTADELKRNFHLISQRFFDKLGKYNFTAIRSISYRVSPAGPMLLIAKGFPFRNAWEANRSEVITNLIELGYGDLAGLYRNFYLFSWRYFLSNYADFESSRGALTNGFNFLKGFADSILELTAGDT